MLAVVFLVLGSSIATLQQTTDSFTTRQTDSTTDQQTEWTATAFQTTLNLPQTEFRINVRSPVGGSCKNQLLCPLQPKSTLSKTNLPAPSKDLVPPFTDEEQRELTTQFPKTIIDVETESLPPTTLNYVASSPRVPKSPAAFPKDIISKPEASNELKSYLPPAEPSPAPTQVDLGYLPPKGVLPAAATVDISKVNYLAPLPASPNPARAPQPSTPEKDLCTDSFHSFLCTPLKTRKKITGALPNKAPQTSYSPSASNTVRFSASTTTTTARPTPSSTPPLYSPLPSNVDRSYLPPGPKASEASASFNSVKVANAIPSTTRKAFSTSTPRPFIHTSIIPYLSPKVVEHFSTAKTTTTKPTTAAPPRTKTTQRTTLPTTIRLIQSPNDLDKSYLPPATTKRPLPKASVLPDFHQKPKVPATTKKPPFIIIPAPSNEIDRGYLPPATTKRPVQKPQILSVFQQKPAAPAVQIITQTTKRVVTTTPGPRVSSASTNLNGSYLPPSPKLESAAAAQVDRAVSPPTPPPKEHHHHHPDHHDHHHHHGKDICSDAFHSFLCAPLKQRKRITGALPPGYNPQSSNRKESVVNPAAGSKPENSFQTETRVKPIVGVLPAANSITSQTTGYSYPKPTVSFPLPSQTVTRVTALPTTGYSYPKPQNPLPLPTVSSPQVVAKEGRVSVTIIKPDGYNYPKPSVHFPLPSEQKPLTLPPKPVTPVPAATSNTGYSYPKPKTVFPLPSELKPQTVAPKPVTPVPAATSNTGYAYPKPKTPFPLPSQQRNVIVTSPKPPQPDKVSYQFPKPSQSLPSSGYQYPKPQKQFVLPNENLSQAPKAGLRAFTDLGSAEFIPVNKIDAKRQAQSGGPRFGERITSRVRSTRTL